MQNSNHKPVQAIIVIPNTGKQPTVTEIEQWKTLLNWKAGQQVLKTIVERNLLEVKITAAES